MKYTVVYWLPNQSKQFSEPKVFATDEKEAYDQAIQIANVNGYEIENVIIEE